MAKCFCCALFALLGLLNITPAHATFIDLHGHGTANQIFVSVPGISVHFLAGSGNLVSTANRFGVDSGGANASDLVDGGGGVAESIFFLFDQSNLVLDSVLISEFDGDDSGEISIKGQPSVSVTNGLNILNLPISATSSNLIRWNGPNTPNTGRGFSVDGFNVHSVPEPSTFAMLTLGGVIAFAVKRR